MWAASLSLVLGKFRSLHYGALSMLEEMCIKHWRRGTDILGCRRFQKTIVARFRRRRTFATTRFVVSLIGKVIAACLSTPASHWTGRYCGCRFGNLRGGLSLRTSERRWRYQQGATAQKMIIARFEIVAVSSYGGFPIGWGDPVAAVLRY